MQMQMSARISDKQSGRNANGNSKRWRPFYNMQILLTEELVTVEPIEGSQINLFALAATI